MNRESNVERYSHCLCLHVRPASLFIGVYFLTTSVSAITKILSSGYLLIGREDDQSRVYMNKPTTTLVLMVNIMMGVVSAMLLYGVTKSKASYLMPFFGIQLYHFLFSLPSSLTRLNLNLSQKPLPRLPLPSGASPSSTEFRWSAKAEEAYNLDNSFNFFVTLSYFLLDIYFICVVWKCYRYLKMKEIAATLNLPYNLDLEIVMPSEVVSSSTVAPPDYETAIKANPPPDYESAIKYQSQHPLSPPITVPDYSQVTTANGISVGDAGNSTNADRESSQGDNAYGSRPTAPSIPVDAVKIEVECRHSKNDDPNSKTFDNQFSQESTKSDHQNKNGHAGG